MPISRGFDVNVQNDRDVLYLCGDADTEGSIRLILDVGDTVGHFERRSSGVFNDTSLRLSASSLEIGRDMTLAATAGYLETNNPSAIAAHTKGLIPHILFDDSGTSDPHMPILAAETDFVVYSTAVSETTSTSIGIALGEVPARIVEQSKHEVGTTGATDSVVVSFYVGTDNTGTLFNRRTLPASDLVADTQLVIEYDNELGFEGDTAIFMEFTSDTAFSLKTDSGGNPLTTHTGHALTEEVIVLENTSPSFGTILLADGTVSAPSLSFTSDTDTGLYLDSTGILAFTTSGEDILKLQSTTPTELSHALITNDFDTNAEIPFVTYGVGSAETLAAVYITSKGGEDVNINVGSSDGPVQIGRAINTGQGILQVVTNGLVTIGTQTNLSGTVGDGDVLALGASTSDATRTRMTLRSPASSQNFFIGINNIAVDSGSVFLRHEVGTEMRLQNSAGTAISISSLDVTVGNDLTVVADLTVDTNTLFVDSTGNEVGIGTITPSAKLHVLETTEQLRLGFDASNFASFTVNTGYNLSAVSFDFISFSILSQETNAQGIAFNSDGSKMYIVGQGNDTVFEYDLSTNFNISTAVFNSVSLSVSSQDGTPRQLEFNTDGTKMFLLGASNDSVFQYTLTTGFDLSTASFDSVSFSVGSQETGPTGLTFKGDGTKFYIVGASDIVFQYSLSTAFDMSTASFDSISFDASSQDTNLRDVKFNLDGTKMFLLGAANESLYQYSLSTAFDVSTATYDLVSFSVTAEEETPRCFTFNSNGTAVFVLGTTNDSVFQYTISPSLSIIPTSEVTSIIGSLLVKTDDADTVSVLNLTTSGTNGGTSSTFVGDQDPDSTITGAGGDIYVRDDGALSNMFFNKEATTGTDWEGISLIPSNVHQLFSTAEYEDLGTASVITTTSNRSLRFNTTVVSSTRHVVTQGVTEAEIQFIDEIEGNQMIYTGSSTFITAATGGDITSRNAALIAAIPGTQLFDVQGRGTLPGTDFLEINSSSNLAQWNLGTISRQSTVQVGPIIRIKDSNIITSTDPLVMDSCAIIEITSNLFEDTNGVGSGGPLFSIKDSSYQVGRVSLLLNGGRLYSGESLVRIDAGLPDIYRVTVLDSLFILRSGATLFDTSGSTGTFTAVADNSISATAITGVTDSSGVASFTHTGTSPNIGMIVTISGFTTNTDYNQTARVTATTATTFEVDWILFGTSETGSYLSNTVTVTSTSHGLTQATGVTLDQDLSTDYDGGFLISNVQTNSFDISSSDISFTSTGTGSWSTEGLDGTDPRVSAAGNPGEANSRILAFGFTNANTNATTITDGTYAAIDASTFVENEQTERFKLTNATNAVFELTALTDFNGFLSGSLSALKTGSTQNYRFAMSTNGAIPTFATANYVPMEVKTTKVNIALQFSVVLSKGDTIQIMVAGDGTANSLTITDLVVGIQ